MGISTASSLGRSSGHEWTGVTVVEYRQSPLDMCPRVSQLDLLPASRRSATLISIVETQFAIPAAMQECFPYPHCHQHEVSFVLLIFAILAGVRHNLQVVLICISSEGPLLPKRCLSVVPAYFTLLALLTPGALWCLDVPTCLLSQYRFLFWILPRSL